jgi:hypothetical protein
VVGVAVTVGIAVTVVIGVGVVVAVTVVVGVGIAVTVAVGVGVGDMLGADVVGARVAGGVTGPLVWGVQAVTARPNAASNAMVSGRASRRRSDRPRSPGLNSCHMTIPSLAE